MKPAEKPPYKCLRCGYEWESRLPEPQVPRACPQCTSRRWNIKRK